MRLVDVDFLAAVGLLTDEEKQVATQDTQALAISVARLRLALRRVLVSRRGMPSIAAFAKDPKVQRFEEDNDVRLLSVNGTEAERHPCPVCNAWHGNRCTSVVGLGPRETGPELMDFHQARLDAAARALDRAEAMALLAGTPVAAGR